MVMPNHPTWFVAKVLLASACISLLIKYGFGYVDATIATITTNELVLTVVMLPTIVLAIALALRSSP